MDAKNICYYCFRVLFLSFAFISSLFLSLSPSLSVCLSACLYLSLFVKPSGDDHNAVLGLGGVAVYPPSYLGAENDKMKKKS